MLIAFSSEASFSEAVGKTFDGDHPCELCKLVKKSKKEEDRKPLIKAEMKLEIALPAPVKVPFPRSEDHAVAVPAFHGTWTTVYQAVPLQPPRLG